MDSRAASQGVLAPPPASTPATRSPATIVCSLSTLTVTNPADSGDGSLRAAIAAAQSGEQIVFDASLKGQTITLTSGPLAITQSLDIEGPGADKLAVSGNHASRIFAVTGGVTVTITGLTITDGMVVGGDGGGAILNAGSSLTLANDVLWNNVVLSDAGGNAQGGAIGNVSGATLTVSNCLLTHNQAKGSSGGSQANGGGIVNSSSRLIVSHSAFSGNQALGGDGGGITDSTIGHNQALGGNGAGGGNGGNGAGGGVYVAAGTVIASASDVNRNMATGGTGADARTNGQGLGGGVYNRGTFLFDAAMLIAGNHASTSNDDGFGY